jgi:hypothetical protein
LIIAGLVKVAIIQKVPMHLSYPQTYEPNYFPELDILIFGSFNAVLAYQAQFLALTSLELPLFKTISISKQSSVPLVS